MKTATPMLECNLCHTQRQASQGSTHDDLRQLLGQVGWYSDKGRDLDLCPACVDKDLY